jgi:cytoskeletal protein CcmA (bactofilin family)
LLRALERESRLLSRAMLEEEEPLPSRLAQFQQRARQSWQWIWGVTFGLAATGAYALYTGYVEPWQQQLDQAGFGGSSLLSLVLFQGAFWKGWSSMITLLEVLALVTLAGLGLAFFRRRMRRGSAFALVLAGLCAAVVLPAAASEMRKGDHVDVGKDESIKGDVFLFSDRVRVDGTVDGDVFVFGHNVDINGHVTGDVFGFAHTLNVTGHVDGNVRAFTNTLTIRGSVAKNVLTFDETVNLESSGKIGGSLTIFVDTLNFDGTLGKDLLLYGKHPIIAGKVGGGIKAKAERLTITSAGEVDGPIWYQGRYPPDVSPQAKLALPPEYHKGEHKPSYMEGHYYVWQLIWAAAFVLFGLVLFALMPKFSADAVNEAERYGASFGLGVLVLFGVPIGAIIACVTVVGMLIGVSAFLLWCASLFFAQVVIGALVGQWLMGRTSEFWPFVGRMVVGVVMVRLFEAIPVIGGWVKFAVVLWGLGAISLALYRRFQPSIAAGMPLAPGSPATPLPPNTRVGGMQPA